MYFVSTKYSWGLSERRATAAMTDTTNAGIDSFRYSSYATCAAARPSPVRDTSARATLKIEPIQTRLAATWAATNVWNTRVIDLEATRLSPPCASRWGAFRPGGGGGRPEPAK